MKNFFTTRIRTFVHRIRGSAGVHDDLDHAMDEEASFHIEMATKRNLERGLSPVEARRRALVAFGGVEPMKEEGREANRMRWLENILQDIRFAFRTLRKSPAFTTAAVLTVALGIAANTAVFSVVNAALLRPLPFPDPEAIRYVGWNWGEQQAISTSTAFQYDFMRRHNRAFEAVATYRGDQQPLGNQNSAIDLNGMRVSGSFFDVIRIRAANGRTFGEDEAAAGAAPVVVLSDAVWRARFGAEPSVIGRTITLGGRERTVIGVLPKDFEFPAMSENTDYLVPFTPEIDPEDEGHNSWVIARTRAGVSAEQRDADIERVSALFKAEHPALSASQESFKLFTHAEAFAADIRTTLLVLLGAVLFVLLIGCANTANLLLVRGAGRRREIALRASLGAGRARIMKQLLTEGLVLSICAAALGVALGSWGLRVLLRLAPETIGSGGAIGLDGRVLLFVSAVTIFSGLVFGLTGALPALRVSLNDTLRDGSRGSTGGGRHARDFMVLAETAFAVVLLAGAGLLMNSFLRLQSVDPGFESRNVLAVRLGKLPPEIKDAQAVERLEVDLLANLRRVPGVQAAAVASNFPLERGMNFPVSPVEHEDLALGDTEWRGVTPGYVDALGIELKAGRDFTDRDTHAAPRVAIVNESLARRFWPNENPIGKRMYVGRFKGHWLDDSLIGETEVIGVTADVREIKLNANAKGTIYLPRAQVVGMGTSPHIIVRSRDAAESIDEIRSAIASADSRLGAPEIESMRAIVGKSVAEPRFRMLIISVFAACALLLAAIGIYGVIAAGVQQSTREIGVRIALGATSSQVATRVLKRCMALVGAGAALGTAMALGLTRFLSSMLYGVTPTDARTFALVLAVLCGVGAIAGYIPARRAARIDPGLALRAE